MRYASHFLCTLALSTVLPAQERILFRQWLGAEEIGSLEVKQEPARHTRREQMKISRMGMDVSQDYEETARRSPDGSIAFTWTIRLAKEPMHGQATWSPKDPGRLSVSPVGGATRVVDVPANGVLWPGEWDARLREGARLRAPIRMASYAFSTQQWGEVELTPRGPDPLPGFPDAVAYTGQERKGELVGDVQVWISPTRGELKTVAEWMGLRILMQREDLPGPAANASDPGVFGQSLKPLPRHAFLSWLDILTVRFSGAKVQVLPEDPQQRMLEKNRYCLLKATVPSPAEARDLPVKGRPSPEEAPFLARSPLVDFQDPVFDGLLFRLRAPRGATRWDLTQRVTRFVYDWINPKDFTVGFASAQEVARHPKGDCTEHGVLAVALLRKLGVPARGVVGWVALKETLGLHFWVEASIGGRWIPVDPTFNEAPASAFRIKLGTTDLADLGSVGWDTAATIFGRDAWVPETGNGAPWGESGILLGGETLTAPGGIQLRVRGGTWRMRDGQLELEYKGLHQVEAIPSPTEGAMEGVELFQSTVSGLKGWWIRKEKLLVLGSGARWLRIQDVDDAIRHDLLDRLRIQEPGR